MGSHVYNVVKAPIGWSLVCHRERIGGYVSSQAALEAATAHGAKALREGHSIQRVRRRFHTAKVNLAIVLSSAFVFAWRQAQRFMRPSMRPLYRQSLVFWLTFYPILPASSQDRPLDPPTSSAATLRLNSPASLTGKDGSAGSGWMSSGSTIAMCRSTNGAPSRGPALASCPNKVGRAEDAPASALCW